MEKEFINFFLECTFFISFNLFPLTVYAQTHTWTQLNPEGAYPGGRFNHSAVYNRGTDSMILFGGFAYGCGGCYNDVWVLNDAVPLPGNASPTETILEPSNGVTFTQGVLITFDGAATDPEDGPLSNTDMIWSSEKDGVIGIGESFSTASLSVNDHMITVMMLVTNLHFSGMQDSGKTSCIETVTNRFHMF